MATASSVSSMLKTHPISLKENLAFICDKLWIELEPKDTKLIIQSKIENFSKLGDENDEKVRNLIAQLKKTNKERMASGAATATPNLIDSQSQSQFLFESNSHTDVEHEGDGEDNLFLEEQGRDEIIAITQTMLRSKDELIANPGSSLYMIIKLYFSIFLTC